MAMSASNMLNRANTLFNVGYGEDLPSRFPDGDTWTKSYMGNDYTDLRSGYTDGETGIKSYMQSDYTDLGTSFTDSEKHGQSPI